MVKVNRWLIIVYLLAHYKMLRLYDPELVRGQCDKRDLFPQYCYCCLVNTNKHWHGPTLPPTQQDRGVGGAPQNTLQQIIGYRFG